MYGGSSSVKGQLVSHYSFLGTSDKDYGSLLCWANNSIGVQQKACVFNIIPAGWFSRVFSVDDNKLLESLVNVYREKFYILYEFYSEFTLFIYAGLMHVFVLFFKRSYFCSFSVKYLQKCVLSHYRRPAPRN